jgi:hypothetical protein
MLTTDWRAELGKSPPGLGQFPGRGAVPRRDQNIPEHGGRPARVGTQAPGSEFLPPGGEGGKWEDGMAGRPDSPWDKAAACETHAQSTKDQKLREKFRRLRDTWIRIANNDALAGDEPRDQRPPTKK